MRKNKYTLRYLPLFLDELDHNVSYYVKNYVVYYVLLEEHGKKIMEVRRFLHAREDRDYTLGVER